MTIELYGHEIDEDKLFEACLEAVKHSPMHEFYDSAVYLNKNTGELRVPTEAVGDYVDPDSDWVKIYSDSVFSEYYTPVDWYFSGVCDISDVIIDDIAEKLNLSDTEKANLINMDLDELTDFCFENSRHEALNKAILDDEELVYEAAFESIDNFIDDLKYRREENYDCR